MPSKPILRLIEDRERLRQTHAAGASGLEVARGLSDAADAALLELWGDLTGVALLALGGYGRSNLSPHSDLDVLVLHHRRADPSERVREASYEIWDAGLELAVALRTPKEAAALARDRFDTEAAYRDLRLIAGDETLFNELLALVSRRRRGFEERLRRSSEDRWASHGDAGAEIEPELKLGRGGLRDAAALGWLVPEPAIDPFCEDFLHRVRHELHWSTGRRTDRLAIAHHRPVAEALGIGGGDEQPEDTLLMSLYRSCRTIFSGLQTALGNPAAESVFESLPEWDRIRYRPQRNAYHRWAVDVHSLECARVAAQLTGDEDPLVARVARDLSDESDLLIAAAALHDIGKGGAVDHSVAGEPLARAAGERLALGPGDVEDLAWLVRNHLLLAETATHRDVEDPRVLYDVASEARDQRRLGLLFLLTVADARATGPLAWGPWRATLIKRLFLRAGEVLGRGELTEELKSIPPIVRGAIAPGPDEVRLEAMEEPGSGVWRVVVIARDRPGLFSKIAGAMALHGLSVVSAEIYTRADGVAVDLFRVETLTAEAKRFEKVAEDAAKALRGRLSLEVHLAAKRRDYGSRSAHWPDEPRVEIDNLQSDDYTIIEAHAPDRAGLLFELTSAMSGLGLDIHLAKVATYGHHLVDVFYVTDLDHKKVEDPEHLIEIRRALLWRLELGI